MFPQTGHMIRIIEGDRCDADGLARNAFSSDFFIHNAT